MLLGDLEDLDDILDDITAAEFITEKVFSAEEETDIIDTCVQLMSDYVDENPRAISDPDFHEIMLENVKDIMFMNYDNFFQTNSDIEDELDELIDIAADMFYLHIMPRRSYNDTFEKKMSEKERDRVIKRLKVLADVPQSTQRTKEWYETRHKLITASNAYKAFEQDSARNQLIYEKCQPLKYDEIEDLENTNPKFELVNTDTAMHHGQKYEPASVMYYEDLFETKISEYGCIQHEKYKFLGASPDGIASDPDMPRFGRMLEIKNIVNRDIDGIPKKEYWIQMQLQMETCDLNECDFLETRFIEYSGYTDFVNDGTFLKSAKDELKGVIMYFSTPEGKPKYVYKPLSMDFDEFESEWEQEQREIYKNLGISWIKNIYWRLEEVSCVLVLRNRKWFQDNIETLADLWDTILKERNTGCAHRAPNKRAKREQPIEETVCLLNLDKLTGKVTLTSSEKSSRSNSIVDGPFFRVRTESIDETKQNNQKDT
jgi:putative phage-type endonuclease